MYAAYDFQKRGSFILNGIKYPSLHMTYSTCRCCKYLNYEDLEEKYLVCVNDESNNYKFYHLLPTANGIRCEYGRIGETSGRFAPR
jgi:hypothetical protein